LALPDDELMLKRLEMAKKMAPQLSAEKSLSTRQSVAGKARTPCPEIRKMCGDRLVVPLEDGMPPV